jgi:FlaA1/EpsC-like NDP-sugar epimerase
MYNFAQAEILVTGGTGSLGSTLVKKFLSMPKENQPKGIRIYSRDEFKQWKLKNEIDAQFTGAPVSYLLGDVRDKIRLSRAMNGVDGVINTAALKQVPACEYNPIEAVHTNINGAENIIDCAIDNKVKKVLHISTDKAVYPVNLYGATKTVAEKLFLHAGIYAPDKTSFSCCRYGNVMASRGSLIPLLKEQFEKTSKVTLTHPDMTRFFVSLDYVTEFILHKLCIMKGEEIFVPKMPTIKIADLIKAVVPDAQIEITGIRPGEKLHEILITPEESENTIVHDFYFTITKQFQDARRWTYSSDMNPYVLDNSADILKYIEEAAK